MEVILLEKIRNLGDIGDRVKVKAGYGRNFLLPQNRAVATTEQNLAKFEQMRAELEKKAAESLALATSRAEALAKLVITISMQASDEGKLFGSVGTREIVDAIQAAGEEIDKHEIILADGVVREIGEHEITLQLHTDVTVPLKVNIVAE